MDVAETDGMQHASLFNARCHGKSGFAENASFVGALNGIAMRVEAAESDLVNEFFVIRLEKKLNPADMMFRGIGMRDLFAHRDGYQCSLIRLDRIRAFDDRDMLLLFPIGRLIKLSQSSHEP